MCLPKRVWWNVHRLTSSNGGVLSCWWVFFDQRDPRAATGIEEVCRLKRVDWNVHRLKSFNGNVLSSVDEFFNQRDQNTATGIEEVCRSKGWAEMFIGWKVQMVTSYLLLACFLPKRSKHFNTAGRSEWTFRGTMLKDKLHLVTFHRSIFVNPGTFWLPLVKFMN